MIGELLNFPHNKDNTGIMRFLFRRDDYWNLFRIYSSGAYSEEYKEENAFEKDLMVILDAQTLIDNYGVWERILEILVVNNRIKLLEQCALRILSAIRRLEIPVDRVCPNGIHVKDGLLRVFRAALCRTTALTWGAEINHVIEKIHRMNNSAFNWARGIIALFSVLLLQNIFSQYPYSLMTNIIFFVVIFQKRLKIANYIYHNNYIIISMILIFIIVYIIRFILLFPNEEPFTYNYESKINTEYIIIKNKLK